MLKIKDFICKDCGSVRPIDEHVNGSCVDCAAIENTNEENYNKAISLLESAHDYMNNTHGYSTDLYAEIGGFLNDL